MGGFAPPTSMVLSALREISAVNKLATRASSPVIEPQTQTNIFRGTIRTMVRSEDHSRI